MGRSVDGPLHVHFRLRLTPLPPTGRCARLLLLLADHRRCLRLPTSTTTSRCSTTSAQSFPRSASWVGVVPAVTQLGYAAGMLLLAPLGDRFDRRLLILLQIAGHVCRAGGRGRGADVWRC